MKLLAFTTRDYYSIARSLEFSGVNKWERKECPLLTEFVERVYNSTHQASSKAARRFYKAESYKEAIAFWEKYRGPFYMCKRVVKEFNFVMYAIPCIPIDYLKEGAGCHSLKIRHDYIGRFLQSIIADIDIEVNPNEFYVATHDLDIFPDNNERNLTYSEVESESVLFQLIKEGSVIAENIFGFQHNNSSGYLYALFSQKLANNEIKENIYLDVSKHIQDTKGKKVERNILNIKDLSSKPIATAKPNSPISFMFSVDTNGLFTCKRNEEFNVRENKDYSLLVDAITNCLNKTKLRHNGSCDCCVHLLIHHIDEIRIYAQEHEVQYVFGQNYFKESQVFHPIIHFCEASLKELAEQFRYAEVVDGSIWNYYVKLERNNDNSVYRFNEEGEKQLVRAVEDIIYNTSRHLYNLVVATESAELVARITYEAYIKRFSDTEGHGDYVSPFVFHSEQAVADMIDKEFRNTGKIDQIKTNKWRILLIDDKAVTPMGQNLGREETVDNLPFNCKLSIIKGVLEREFFKNIIVKSWDQDIDFDTNSSILIEYVQTRKESLKALRKKKYDIVLMDYLLDEEPGGRHCYGYQILEEIYNACDPKANIESNGNNTAFLIGPSKRYFFMFISAYSSAVNARLLAEGLNLSEDYWHISLGACPTNTPSLFLYNIIKLFEKRLDDAGINNLSMHRVVELMNNIFSSENVRKAANSNYHSILMLQHHYRNILEDVEIPIGENKGEFDTKGSVLMTHFLNKNLNLGGLLEHLAQLIHLTAFGTVRQWPEMWEEYLYIKALLDKQRLIEGNENSEFDSTCSKIEIYILALKSSAI